MKNCMKQLRQENGISQEQMAERLGESRQTIISIENGYQTVSLLATLTIITIFSSFVVLSKRY